MRAQDVVQALLEDIHIPGYGEEPTSDEFSRVSVLSDAEKQLFQDLLTPTRPPKTYLSGIREVLDRLKIDWEDVYKIVVDAVRLPYGWHNQKRFRDRSTADIRNYVTKQIQREASTAIFSRDDEPIVIIMATYRLEFWLKELDFWLNEPEQ